MDDGPLENATLIAQRVICAYPISDIYAPTPRYLYYVLLTLTFLLPRTTWLSKAFLGAVTAYAGTAALNAFILVGSSSNLQKSQPVSIPLVSQSPPLQIDEMITAQQEVMVQPDTLELDLDVIMAVVVTACLTGLPLQAWSRTSRSSRMVHYLVLLWNAIILGATISALLAWPANDTTMQQYRFCYSSYLDPSPQQYSDWSNVPWRGSWNSTVNFIFGSANVWQNLTDNCLYPCFNTTQILRQSSSLKASVPNEGAKLGKLHDPLRHGTDEFKPLMYTAVIVFVVAQVFLIGVARLRLCSPYVPIYQPGHLWKDRKSIWKSLTILLRKSWQLVVHYAQRLFQIVGLRRKSHGEFQAKPAFSDLLVPIRLMIDVWTILVLLACVSLFPITIIGFVCWIEWYIRNDGLYGETPRQVGQWAPVVSIAILLLAAFAMRLGPFVASRQELMDDVEEKLKELNELHRELDKHDQEALT